jgi:hypothetical protein
VPNTDEVVRILEAGVNVVSTAAFINGKCNPADRDRIAAACERGGASMFGTGISPGLVELVGVAVAGLCDRIDKITIDEGSDTTLYDSPATELPCGFGRSIDDPELAGMAAKGTAVFGEAVAMVADALGVELDDIVCKAEYATATEDVVMASWTIPAGHVAGVYASWQGRVGDRTVIELNVRWRKGKEPRPRLADPRGPRDPGRRPTHGHGDAPISSSARLQGDDLRRVHGARDDHDGDAGRERNSPRGGAPPASSPTPTSRCRLPRGWVPEASS